MSTSFYPWHPSREEMYQALPALPYCKQRKAGRGNGNDQGYSANGSLVLRPPWNEATLMVLQSVMYTLTLVYTHMYAYIYTHYAYTYTHI